MDQKNIDKRYKNCNNVYLSVNEIEMIEELIKEKITKLVQFLNRVNQKEQISEPHAASIPEAHLSFEETAKQMRTNVAILKKELCEHIDNEGCMHS